MILEILVKCSVFITVLMVFVSSFSKHCYLLNLESICYYIVQ
jgi:hypothetical protein